MRPEPVCMVNRYRCGRRIRSASPGGTERGGGSPNVSGCHLRLPPGQRLAPTRDTCRVGPLPGPGGGAARAARADRPAQVACPAARWGHDDVLVEGGVADAKLASQVDDRGREETRPTILKMHRPTWERVKAEPPRMSHCYCLAPLWPPWRSVASCGGSAGIWPRGNCTWVAGVRGWGRRGSAVRLTFGPRLGLPCPIGLLAASGYSRHGQTWPARHSGIPPRC